MELHLKLGQFAMVGENEPPEKIYFEYIQNIKFNQRKESNNKIASRGEI